MALIAESRRNKFWFGTEEYMSWFPAPNRGADVSPEGWSAGGTLLNGGGYQLNSFGAHKNYIFEWPSSSSREAAQKMQSYAAGTYGRGLIYFIDPLTWTTNMLPAQLADPSTALGYEGASLVYGVDPVGVPTSGWETNELPVQSAYYDLAGVAAGWRGKEQATFIPIPTGYTLSLGSFHSQTGNGRVFYREQSTNGALGTITALTPLASNSSQILNTFISGPSLAGVWIYVGKSASGAGSVTLSAMIGRLIESVRTQSTLGARNHAPSLYGPTSMVTVRRNLVPSPVNFSAGLELSRCTISASGGIVTGTVNAVGFFPRVITTQVVRGQFPVTPGDQMTGSFLMHTNGVTYNFRMQWFTTPSTSLSVTSTTAHTGVAGQYVTRTETVPAGAVYGQIEIGVANNTPVSTQFAYSEPQFVVGTQRLPFWAVGLPSPYAGLTPAWAGTAESSPTLLLGEHLTALTDYNCVSTVYDEDGKRWLRITATNPASASSYVAYSVPAGPLRTAGTALGRVKVLSAQGGTPHPSARGIRVLSPEFKAQAANAPGETDLRLPYANLTSTYEVGLFHGLNRGSADVSWTDIGLFEGNYDGPWFDGDSGVVVIGGASYRTQWDGTQYQSPSSAWSLTPAFDSLKEGPWMGGQGHSGCRFIGKPTYINNTGVEGGQVGFAASFREVGSWIYG